MQATRRGLRKGRSRRGSPSRKPGVAGRQGVLGSPSLKEKSNKSGSRKGPGGRPEITYVDFAEVPIDNSQSSTREFPTERNTHLQARPAGAQGRLLDVWRIFAKWTERIAYLLLPFAAFHCFQAKSWPSGPLYFLVFVATLLLGKVSRPKRTACYWATILAELTILLT